VVSLISSEPGFCTTNLCSRNQGCFFGRVRKAVHEASFVIVNHALLLSEIGAPGFLPPYSTVIIDEAHNLIHTAYSQFTIQLDRFLVALILQNLDPNYQSNLRWSKVLKQLGGLYSEFLKLYKQLEQDVVVAIAAADAFFDALSYQYASRYSLDDVYPRKYVIDNLVEEYHEVFGELKHLEEALEECTNVVRQIGKELLAKDNSRRDYPELHQVFEQRLDQVQDLIRRLNVLTGEQDPEWVYWQEGRFQRRGRKKEQLQISIHTAPVDVAPLLAEFFFQSVRHCVLTSATLQVDDTFDYFLNRSGLNRLEHDRVTTRSFPSPFYYDEQVTYLQYGGSEPITTNPAALATVIYYCHKKYNKRIMALFTSHNTLNSVYRELRTRPEGRDLPVFAQVYGTSRFGIIRGMHQTPNGILLGTNTFWEGVDLPGDLLEILIITKLPFDVPSEPVIRAYAAKVRAEGGNSFDDYAVPECVIKFRQGFGRLIRTTTDQGIFIVLDNRVVTKGYGRHFSAAIPVQMQIFTHLEDLR
jgi:Rad3-related DNA helicase